MTRLLTILLLATTLYLPGCIKYKQVVSLMPDGSGKIELTWGLSKQMTEMAKANGEDPFENLKPEKFKSQAKGVAAFSKPERSSKDGYEYLTYNVYFEDINKLTLDMNQSKENADGSVESLDFGKPANYRYEREGETATLTIEQGVVMSMASEYEAPPAAEREQMRQLLAGFEINESVVLPGTFADVPGAQGVDNTIILRVTLDEVLDGSGPLEAFKDKQKMVIKINDITVTDEQVAAFKKEMQAAVKASEDAK